MQINANDLRLCSLATGQFLHFARRLTLYAYMINEVGVSGQKWCGNDNVSAGAKGFWADAMFGFQEAARDSWRKRCTRCHTPTTVTAALHEAAHLWLLSGHSKPTPPPLLSSPLLQWDPVFSYSILVLFTSLFPFLNPFIALSFFPFSPSCGLSPSLPPPHTCLSTPLHLYCWIQTGYLYLSAWLPHLPLP